MDRAEEKYEKIIQHLRETEPVLSQKEKLSDEIITRIKDEELSVQTRTKVFTLIIRPVMTAAALFLVGFFLFQQVEFMHSNSKTSFSNEIKYPQSNAIQHPKITSEELSKELGECFNEATKEFEYLDKKCVVKLFLLYNKLEKKERRLQQQRIKNWFNH